MTKKQKDARRGRPPRPPPHVRIVRALTAEDMALLEQYLKDHRGGRPENPQNQKLAEAVANANARGMTQRDVMREWFKERGQDLTEDEIHAVERRIARARKRLAISLGNSEVENKTFQDRIKK